MIRRNKPNPRRGVFHLLAWGGTNSSTAGVTAQDLTAFTDPEFSTRNNHYLFSEKYNILADALFGSTVSRGRILCPTFNSVTAFNVWPINESTIPASPPRLDMWFKYPVPLPMNEEVQAVVDATGVDTFTFFAQIAPPEWMQPVPQGMPPVPIFEMRFTCTPTFTTGNWSTLVNMSFEQSLRGGTYAVCGLQLQGTRLLAGRIVFPQNKYVSGRRLRPGVIANALIGDEPAAFGQAGPLVYGEFGRFSTAELPQLEATGLGSSTAAVEGRMHLVRLSESINVRYDTPGPY